MHILTDHVRKYMIDNYQATSNKADNLWWNIHTRHSVHTGQGEMKLMPKDDHRQIVPRYEHQSCVPVGAFLISL